MLGVAGSFEFYSKEYFYVFFIIIGLTQSIVFPCLVSVIAMWFSKKHRGAITGFWGTCTNIGNIIGLQVSA
jgi:OPA family glycerol-3-phosphate transporter-like MFS transporter 3